MSEETNRTEDSRLRMVYLTPDMIYITVGAFMSSSHFHGVANLKQTLLCLTFFTGGSAIANSYKYNTDFLVELTVAAAEFTITAITPYYASLAAITTMGLINIETKLYYHHLLRSSVDDAMEFVENQIKQFVPSYDNDATETPIVGITASEL